MYLPGLERELGAVSCGTWPRLPPDLQPRRLPSRDRHARLRLSDRKPQRKNSERRQSKLPEGVSAEGFRATSRASCEGRDEPHKYMPKTRTIYFQAPDFRPEELLQRQRSLLDIFPPANLLPADPRISSPVTQPLDVHDANSNSLLRGHRHWTDLFWHRRVGEEHDEQFSLRLLLNHVSDVHRIFESPDDV